MDVYVSVRVYMCGTFNNLYMPAFNAALISVRMGFLLCLMIVGYTDYQCFFFYTVSWKMVDLIRRAEELFVTVSAGLVLVCMCVRKLFA